MRFPRTAAVVALIAGELATSSPAHTAVEQQIHLTARKFEYSPNQITLKEGTPVVLEIRSLDRKHGFSIPELGVRADVPAGKSVVVRFTPAKAGTFHFHCDVFCGSGHEGMEGTIVVEG